MPVHRQVPETRLPLPISTQRVAGFAETAVEAQIVSDGVFPAVRSRLEKWKMLSCEVVDLLDPEASAVAVLQRQRDEDAVVDRRAGPPPRIR